MHCLGIVCTSFSLRSPQQTRPQLHPNSTDRASDPPTAGLDITSLVPTIHKLFAAGLAPSTKRAYHSRGVCYRKFCADAKVTPFPTSEKILLLFVSFLHQQQLSHGTIKSYLVVVRYEQIAQGMGSPNIGAMPQLEYVLKGQESNPSQFQVVAPHNSRHPAQAETSVAAGSKATQYEYVVGRLMSLFFRLPALRKNCVAVGEKF